MLTFLRHIPWTVKAILVAMIASLILFFIADPVTGLIAYAAASLVSLIVLSLRSR